MPIVCFCLFLSEIQSDSSKPKIFGHSLQWMLKILEKFIPIFAKISSNYNELNEHIFEFSSIILHVVRTIFTCEKCFIIVTFTRCSNNVYIWTILHVHMKIENF